MATALQWKGEESRMTRILLGMEIQLRSCQTDVVPLANALLSSSRKCCTRERNEVTLNGVTLGILPLSPVSRSNPQLSNSIYINTVLYKKEEEKEKKINIRKVQYQDSSPH